MGDAAGADLAVGERLGDTRFVIRDRDAKFSGPFDDVLETEDVRVIRTPIRASKANAFTERWVRTVRRECLDHLLILGRRQLERVPLEYAIHYNRNRPHRGLALAVPEPSLVETVVVGGVLRRDRLDGLIHEYYREAA